MVIPRKHRALSSGALAPGAGTPGPRLGLFTWVQRLMKARAVLFVPPGMKTGDVLVRKTARGVSPEVFTIEKKGGGADAMSRPEWLSGRDERDHFVYRVGEIPTTNEIRRLPGGWLVLNHDGAPWLKFAVLEFFSSAPDRSDEQVTCLFHGEGPSGSLRECRHTWWGENGDGYCFYPNGPLITAALKELSTFFDGMVPREGAPPDP